MTYKTDSVVNLIPVVNLKSDEKFVTARRFHVIFVRFTYRFLSETQW